MMGRGFDDCRRDYPLYCSNPLIKLVRVIKYNALMIAGADE